MSARQSAVPKVPVHTGVVADVRLQQLGIPGPQPLLTALNDGASCARATTGRHPAAYRGQRMWGETVASLRVALASQGWMAENFKGVDLVLEPRRGVALVVTAGDPAVGDQRYSPQVRYERREVMKAMVNNSAPTLWGDDDPLRWEVWFLLHHLTSRALEAELSRASVLTSDGGVAAWMERILLPQTTFGPTPKRRPEVGAPPAIEVDVQRRAL